MSWKSLGLRTLGGYVLVIVARHIFFPDPTGQSWLPAPKFVYYAISYSVPFICIFFIISIVALLFARVPIKNRSKPLPPFLNRALIGTIVVSGLMIWGGWYNEKTPDKSPSPVLALITSQDAGGIDTNDLNQEQLKDLASRAIQTWIQEGKSLYEKKGHDPRKFDPKVDSISTVNAKGKELAVVKLTVVDPIRVRVVTVIGIVRGKILKVECSGLGDHDIMLFSGECGSKIKEAFGVSITP